MNDFTTITDAEALNYLRGLGPLERKNYVQNVKRLREAVLADKGRNISLRDAVDLVSKYVGKHEHPPTDNALSEPVKVDTTDLTHIVEHYANEITSDTVNGYYSAYGLIVHLLADLQDAGIATLPVDLTPLATKR